MPPSDDLPVPYEEPFDDQTLDVIVEQNRPWMPERVEEAEWAARKLAEYHEAYEVLQAEVDDYHRRVKAWARAKLESGYGAALTQRIRFFEDRLKIYALAQREAAPKARDGSALLKTIELPSATIRTVDRVVRRGVEARYEIVDYNALLLWAEESAPDAITRLVAVPPLLERLAPLHPDTPSSAIWVDTGEVVPGLLYHPGNAAEREITATVELRESL